MCLMIGSLRFSAARASTCGCFVERRDVVERVGIDCGVICVSGILMIVFGVCEVVVVVLVVVLVGCVVVVATNATTVRRGVRCLKLLSDVVCVVECCCGVMMICFGVGGCLCCGVCDCVSFYLMISRRTINE